VDMMPRDGRPWAADVIRAHMIEDVTGRTR
jgi:hypothetical protein